MLRCRNVTEIVGTDAILTASWRTRLQVRAHLLMCRHCRAYLRSIRTLAHVARRAVEGVPPSRDARDEAVIAAVMRVGTHAGTSDLERPGG
jgi:predicted anti-sigma-YlaC factor YlaD